MRPRAMPNATDGLIAHFPFSADCEDHAGAGLSVRNHGVRLVPAEDGPHPGRAARFDGTNAFLEVADHPVLHVGREDFSVAAWVRTDETSGDVAGDLLDKFDPATRRGFHLGIVSHAGVVGTQSNYRNLHFGIDAGIQDPAWTDCGRPGACQSVPALTVHEGALYAGTFEAAGGAGRLHRYLGEGRWLDCGAPDGSNAVSALAVYRGRLYCGTGRYDAAGSRLPPSPNVTPGGRLFRYEGGCQWTDCGQIGNTGDMVIALTVFRDHLYAAHLYHPGVWRFDGERGWSAAGLQSQRLIALTVFHDQLIGFANGGANQRYLGDGQWESLGQPPGSTQTYAGVASEGELYAGTWPLGQVFRHAGGQDWVLAGQWVGYEKEVMGMNVYNGKMYCGTLPSADIYRFDAPDDWTRVGQLDRTPDAILRRAWSLCVHGGRLYAGTLPSGHVFSFEAGKMATCDRPWPEGWHHVAAVKEGGFLRVYLDGAPAAASGEFRLEPFALTNDRPLRIGRGPSDFFRGTLRDLRIYRRALAAEDSRALALAPGT
jgi:hypothetical protein